MKDWHRIALLCCFFGLGLLATLLAGLAHSDAVVPVSVICTPAVVVLFVGAMACLVAVVFGKGEK